MAMNVFVGLVHPGVVDIHPHGLGFRVGSDETSRQSSALVSGSPGLTHGGCQNYDPFLGP